MHTLLYKDKSFCTGIAIYGNVTKFVQVHICSFIPITADNGKEMGGTVHGNIPHEHGDPVHACNDVPLWPLSATAWCLVVAIHSARTRKIRQIDKDAFQVSITMQIQAYAIKIFLYILP